MNKKRVFVILVTLIVCSLLGCNNFFQPQMPGKPTTGKGYVSLSIDGVQVGRTILPKATADDFNSYKLVFAPVDGEEFTVNITPADLAQPILLDAGKYTLKVYAYRDTDCQKLAAEGETELEIIPDVTTSKTLILKVKEEATGTGTFSWDIECDGALQKAVMTITYFNPDPEVGEVPAEISQPINVKTPSSIELPAGYYRVVIKLIKISGSEEETAVLREILYISPNMKSPLEYKFTDSDFTRAIFVTKETDYKTGEFVIPGSLREAINKAKLRGGSSTIIIDSSVDTITLKESLETGSCAGPIFITIEGNGVTITKDSTADFSLLSTGDGFNITIRRIHFKGGKAASFGGYPSTGGAISSMANLTLESCIFSENQADKGGAISSSCGTTYIKGCTFYGNSAKLAGGAIQYENTALEPLYLTGNLFYGNTAPEYPVVNPDNVGNVISNGRNVVDVPLGPASNRSGWSQKTGDTYTSDPTVMQTTFKPFTGSTAENALTALPPDYPTADFYGYPIARAAGAIQEIETGSVYKVTFITDRYTIKISSVAVKSGDEIEGIEKFYTLALPGNEFLGWYTDNTRWYKGPITRNITLYAKWEIETIEGSDLAKKLDTLLGTGSSPGQAESGGYYTIELEDDETIGLSYLLYYDDPVTIVLKSNSTDPSTIDLFTTGSMFTIGAQVTLILENITLKGLRYENDGVNNNAPLVQVDSGGTLIMENGSKITGNINEQYGENKGGGVYVKNGGTFTMNGGTIGGDTPDEGGNTSSGGSGGGVCVEGGTFTMSGGAISYNKTINRVGGGVYVNSGTFTMSGGEIKGNISGANGGGGGGGVYVKKPGRFIMSGGEIKGNTVPTDGCGGGGVYMDGTFQMTGGIIYGDNEGDNSNTLAPKYGGSGTALNVTKDGTAQYGTEGNWKDFTLLEYWDNKYTDDTIRVVDGKWVRSIFYVEDATQWYEACDEISGGKSGNSYTINVTDDFMVNGTSTPTFGSVTGINVTIKRDSYSSVHISLDTASNGSLLIINSGQTVAINSINLQGKGSGYDNTDPLVRINGGILNMGGGSIAGNKMSGNSVSGGGVYVNGGEFNMSGNISNNEINITTPTGNGYGGGVYVGNGGTLKMYGSITGNKMSGGNGYGGGVYVGNGGTLKMYSGSISENEISGGNGYGGGVYVGSNGAFQIIMYGSVYGTDHPYANTASNGAMLYVSTDEPKGIAQYCNMGEMGDITVIKQLVTTDDTISYIDER